MNEYDYKIQTGKVYQELKETIKADLTLNEKEKQELINKYRKRLFGK